MPAEQNTKTPEISNALTSWRRRPFSGLRWQLTYIYIILFSIFIILFCLLASFLAITSPNPGEQVPIIEGAALLLIALGAIAVYVLSSVVLRPLRHLSDAAQTITLGDLQQRERLRPLLRNDDEVGKLAASLSVIVDQLERTTREKASQDSRFRRLFSDASHQLRTPLTSIRGFTEVLMRGAKDDPETMQRVLKLMKNEAERMTRLVNDILMLARLDEGTLSQRQELDLADVAVEVIEHAKVLAQDKREITLYFATDERLSVKANADHLKQVLHILIDNALKYGRPAPDGWIRLELDEQNGHALMHVKDNGKGIHPNDVPNIFDCFYRGQHIPTYDDTPPPMGAGMGLAIAIAIIHAHEGDILVKSNPNTETVFTVKLPQTVK